MRFVSLLLLASCSIAALAQDCKNPSSAPEVNECAAMAQKRVERELNTSYARVLKAFDKPDTETEKYAQLKQMTITTQRAWVAFRRADCELLQKRNEAGSAKTVIFLDCMQRHAERRIVDLKMLLE
jgi:uncharacterized protein YecT (DUF1311 family)